MNYHLNQTFDSNKAFNQHRETVDKFRIQRIKDALKAFSDVSIFCLQEVERDLKIVLIASLMNILLKIKTSTLPL